MSKKQLGQFFTVNSSYILKDLNKYIKGKDVIDPFAGGGDLLLWAKENSAKSVIGYDVDKKYVDNKKIYFNDSLNNPLKYKFVLTNPPYLNINKADKETKEKYFKNHNFEDLYQISIASIMNSEEGIMIVPINFISAENSKKIKQLFFSKFEIVEMNYFKHQVFPDTTYNVIAFYYKKKLNMLNDTCSIKTHIYSDGKIVNVELKKQFNWTIGGEFLSLIKNQKNNLGIYRLTEKDLRPGTLKIQVAFNHVKYISEFAISKNNYDLIKSNIILLKAIDSGSEAGKIALENIKDYGLDCLVSKDSSRHMIYLISKKKISIEKQKTLIQLFNKEINRLRENYLSLFLTNYRDNNRKRISFDFVYKFINYLYFNQLERTNNVNLFMHN